MFSCGPQNILIHDSTQNDNKGVEINIFKNLKYFLPITLFYFTLVYYVLLC